MNPHMLNNKKPKSKACVTESQVILRLFRERPNAAFTFIWSIVKRKSSKERLLGFVLAPWVLYPTYRFMMKL